MSGRRLAARPASSAAAGITDTASPATAGLLAPSLDQQQHQQERARRQRGRDQQQRQVRRHVRALAGIRRRITRCAAAARRPGERERGRDRERDRHLHDEDRLPRERAGQDAADRRADRRPGHARGAPERDRALLGVLLAPPAARARRSRPPRRPSACRQRFATRASSEGAAAHSAEANAKTTKPPPSATPLPPPRPARRRHRGERQHEVERGQHPRDLGHLGVELAQDVRQPERHHRRVREHQADGGGKRGASHFSRRERRRSFSTRPPVWHDGQ